MTSTETYEIEILDKGMHCDGCEARVQNVLGRLAGVEKVNADHKTQLVRITLDPSLTSVQKIKEKLGDLVYKTVQ